MGAGSLDSIQRAAREGFNLLLDQIAPVELIIERVAAYRHALQLEGRPYRPGQIGVARALQIVRTEEERQQAYNLRIKVLKAIGGLARGPGAERYRNIGSHAEADLAGEEAALLGTPDRDHRAPEKARSRGRRLCVAGRPDGLDGGTERPSPKRSCRISRACPPPAAVEEERR